VILPDGSRTLIPAAWTDRNGGLDTELSSTLVASVDGLEDLCLIGDLLKVRAVVDALLSRLAESAPEQEGDHAVGVGVSRDSSGAGRTIKGPWEQIDPRAQVAALALLSRLIAQMLAANTTPEGGDE